MVARLGRLVQAKNWFWFVLKEMVRSYFLYDYIAMHKKYLSKENFSFKYIVTKPANGREQFLFLI